MSERVRIIAGVAGCLGKTGFVTYTGDKDRIWVKFDDGEAQKWFHPHEVEFITNTSAEQLTNPCKEIDLSVGTKLDTGKPPLSLISREAQVQEAQVLAFGANKYARNNWRKGMDWSRVADATLRHVLAWVDGEDLDPETRLSHLAHARTELGFLIEYQAKAIGTDDRYKKEAN